ncbi:MAG: endonuclease MutS2 [Chloroflexi bacterium]|nr:endonuclease MutS2 [Chloroflexota bacterium]
MDDRHLDTLEFPKILARLARHTSFPAGRELAEGLRPTPYLSEARARQEETSEARQLLATSGGSLGGARDVRPLLGRAHRMSVLLPGELLDIRQTLLAGRTLRRQLTQGRGAAPRLAEIASRIEECAHVAAAITQAINEKGEVLDSASPRLGGIRRELESAHQRLLDRLNRLVASSEYGTYLQEPIVTQRQGRYVIPLRAEFKGRIPGLIHDQSASGATMFIEPLATVELNNRWRELQLEEEQEIHRILLELTDLVAQESRFIEQTVEALAELDLVFARARYAEELRAVEPNLVAPRRPAQREAGPQHPGSLIELWQARHPLLDAETVVPIDVHLDEDYFVLVVTGPNTGGKTVSLKTVGLLVAMAQAGLAIPAAEGSRLSVFEGLYADIGDEQSIEQSLSTFSSHMSRIIEILRQADERSLVLLDELGAGTDPVEGSALARAILTHLVGRGVTTFATTHYSELKLFAHKTPGVQNASVEFDLESLSPTYELTIGLPGRSNAFAIAQRLGLSREIIEEARALVAPETLEAETLLAEIKQTQRETQAAYEETRQRRSAAETLQEELSRRLADTERARREILREARDQAAAELQMVRRELARLRRRPWRAPAEEPSLNGEEMAAAEERLEELAQELTPLPARGAAPLLAPKPGDQVWVTGLCTYGELLTLNDEEAEVRVGSFRVRVPLLELEAQGAEPAAAPPTPPAAPRGHVYRVAAEGAPLELDCRGLTVDETIDQIGRYLDRAFLEGLPQVRIIHGKGTGALRRAVREELARHPLVSSFRPGGRHEGGEGVTVAELAQTN